MVTSANAMLTGVTAQTTPAARAPEGYQQVTMVLPTSVAQMWHISGPTARTDVATLPVVSQQLNPQLPPPEIQTAPVQPPNVTASNRPPETEDDSLTVTRCAKVEVLEVAHSGWPVIQRVNVPPKVEVVTQHLSGSIGMPGNGNTTVVDVKVLLDSGSGVPTISQELVEKLKQTWPDANLTGPFDGRATHVEADQLCTCYFGVIGVINTKNT